ncbi:hypothetical protein BX600DRAFT_512602 [Xylariales sp. PMI_506]|nr:hypothetical protein BX600DRAFT_512602 [Xylariales sp. PMI_506]
MLPTRRPKSSDSETNCRRVGGSTSSTSTSTNNSSSGKEIKRRSSTSIHDTPAEMTPPRRHLPNPPSYHKIVTSPPFSAYADPYPPTYKKREYRDVRSSRSSSSSGATAVGCSGAYLPGWAIIQLGLRIASLFLAGIVVGCSIRGYVTGLILWLPLSIVIFVWEVSELLVFAVNRTHGIHPTAHIIMELIITLSALAYTGLSIYEVYVFRGYRSIVEFAVVAGLCAIISGFHAILLVRAYIDSSSNRRGDDSWEFDFDFDFDEKNGWRSCSHHSIECI